MRETNPPQCGDCWRFAQTNDRPGNRRGDRAHRQVAYMVAYAVIYHLVTGCLVLYDAAAGNMTALAPLNAGLPNRFWVAGLLLAVGAIAGWGLLGGRRSVPLFALLPQQFVLMVSAFSAISATVQGHFPDGVARPWAFIAADQLPAVLAACLHTLALLEVYAEGSWKRPT